MFSQVRRPIEVRGKWDFSSDMLLKSVTRKVEQIFREEMDVIGGQKQ